MRPFHEFSLRNKLISINMLTAVIILLLTSFALLIVKTVKNKNSTIDRLTITSNIICLYNSAELAFNDKITATATLAALDAKPSIEDAVLYDTNMNVFAYYQRPSSTKNTIIPHIKVSEKFPLPIDFKYQQGGYKETASTCYCL